VTKSAISYGVAALFRAFRATVAFNNLAGNFILLGVNQELAV
jgi:predicted HTH transcriptional regulator